MVLAEIIPGQLILYNQLSHQQYSLLIMNPLIKQLTRYRRVRLTCRTVHKLPSDQIIVQQLKFWIKARYCAQSRRYNGQKVIYIKIPLNSSLERPECELRRSRCLHPTFSAHINMVAWGLTWWCYTELRFQEYLLLLQVANSAWYRS